MPNANDVPLMFQAPIPERGKIQYAGDPEPAKKWVSQWLKGAPAKPPEVTQDDNVPLWKRRPVPVGVLPGFGKVKQVWEYQINWRLVTNSGQDKDVILPVIGAKGMPFFPGSSMKGLFLRACPVDKRSHYCGGEGRTNGQVSTKPGLLRFHGGYPTDMDWAQVDRLVDIVHGQQQAQVEGSASSSANVLLSLYRPKMKFGVSSVKPIADSEWKEIQAIWEQALALGLGSRVSAGYGYVEGIADDDRTLLRVHLNGNGLAPTLLTKKEEFRPNVFKAALRGHTLRILGGLTNATNAKLLTQKIWGGIEGGKKRNEPVVGSLGIQVVNPKVELGQHTYTNDRGKKVTMPTYDFQSGELCLLKTKECSPELEKFVTALVKFAMLLGGFGKSWRRSHHGIFYPEYLQNSSKPMIGCHWEFLPQSQDLAVTAAKPDLGNIQRFLREELPSAAQGWMRSEGVNPGGVADWREAWSSQNVRVYGRLADGEKGSRAVHWFHDGESEPGQWIKKKALGGSMGTTGRIWHRMYPRYVLEKGQRKLLTRQGKGQYVEFVTVFPDGNADSRSLLNYLALDNSGFTLLFGG